MLLIALQFLFQNPLANNGMFGVHRDPPASCIASHDYTLRGSILVRFYAAEGKSCTRCRTFKLPVISEGPVCTEPPVDPWRSPPRPLHSCGSDPLVPSAFLLC